jgi:two-component SAPR family response regulator
VGLNYIIRLEDIDDRVKICVITAFDEFKNQFPYLEKKEYSIWKPVGIEDLIRKVNHN